MSAYTPPPGNAVPLDFTGGPYTPPAGNAVPLEFRRGAPPSDDQFVFPLGWASSAVGQILVAGTLVTPDGWLSSFMPAPAVANAARAVLTPGIAPPSQSAPSNDYRQLPNPWISYRIRYITPGGIAIPTNQIATTHVIAFDVQFIDLAGRGPNPWVTGNARVEYAVRYIEPPFIASNIFGSHNVARIQVVAPSGWESSFISENHEFDINLQRILHHSGEADPTEYGATHVRNQFEVLRPTGWLSQNINFPVIYNLDQYLFVQPYMGMNSDPTQWPPYSPFVENKARTLGAFGHQSSRVGLSTWIRNNAAPVLPKGTDMTLWGAGTFIAHRNRTVQAQGWDSFYNERYTVVWNKADVVGPAGVGDLSVFGRPNPVANLNHEVKHHSGWLGPEWGVPFVAFARRFVASGLFYDAPASFPEVRFNPYQIAPVSIAPPQFGGHTVYEHFTTAYPKSVNVHAVPWVGEPIVASRNKTLRVFPSDQSLYGLVKVFNYNIHLTITAGDLTVWGSHLISYRTRTITVAPISVPVFSVTHRIRNVIPDPPARQLIEPNGLYIGLKSNPGIVPSPGIRLATIYPEGINEEGYGKPILTRNTIEVPPGPFNLDQVGTPTLIFTQYLFPRIIPWPNTTPPVSSSDQNWVWVQRPRVTPHTIYAPAGTEATQQANYNHPQNSPHVIGGRQADGQWSLGNGWPWFGRPNVSNQHRVVGPVPNHNSGNPPGLSPTVRFGNQTFTLSRQYVYPTGIRSLRFGQIIFLNVPQYVNLDGETNHQGIAPSTQWGANAVGYPPVQPSLHRPVYPVGFSATLWGARRVELLHRTITASGIPHRGNPQQFLTTPWGIALVGYPRSYTIGMGVQTLWGSSLIEFKNRPVYPAGWNNCSLEDGNFDDYRFPMKVIRKNPLVRPTSMGDVAVFGTCTVSHCVRTVYSRGVDGYNSGSHSVKASSTIGTQGWESLLIGDIDRWEAGKIKAHGDDMSGVGIPRLLHPLRASGFDSGVVAAPRIAPVVSPVGIPSIAFDGPSVTNPFGCTNRVVSPLPILSNQTVPLPVVV